MGDAIGAFPGNDRFEEECGVFGGVIGSGETGRISCFALYALQHRGQESAGIAIGNGEGIWLKKGMGLVSEVFPDMQVFSGVEGCLGVGHVRYSSGRTGVKPENSQPLLFRYRSGEVAISSNGNLVNYVPLRESLESRGSIFQTSTDSELLAHLIARDGNGAIEESLKKVVPELRGGYAFVLLTGDKVIGIRDPMGNRPLSLGRFSGKGYVLASETCAFDTIGADFVRDVDPGEMVVITEKGMESYPIASFERPALCVFEYIYFARPDSNLSGRNVHMVRRELGRRLSQEQGAHADIVTGVPDSSIAAASGFAEKARLPYEMGLIKNRYIGRTFIQPSDEERRMGVGLKLNPVKKIVEGKRMVIVDDSIVRGTTSLRMIRMLRDAGASEVHMRISSPPVISPCYYGINTPTTGELIAGGRTVEEVAAMIGADSLGYLSIEGMIESVGLPEDRLCLACFTGNYPLKGTS